jgi:release factor glutamine methyltransferase
VSEALELQAAQCAQLLALPPLLPRIDRLLSRLNSVAHRLRGLDSYDQHRLERVAGLHLLITPTVFNPRLLRTGAYFAGQIDARIVQPHWTVLDMGTGSGVCALAAARHARRVVAVDVNPAAVRCAQLNALLNELQPRLEVRQGDLFGPLAGERFDLVLFNPPFVPGAPRNDRERAWYAGDVAARFAAGLSAHLKPGGRALVLLSSFGDGAAFLAELARHGFTLHPYARRRYLGEHLVIFTATPRPAGLE